MADRAAHAGRTEADFRKWRLPAASTSADVPRYYIRSGAAASWLNDLVANSDHHSLGAGHCTKLSTKMRDVCFDRSAADVQNLADLPA